MIPDDSAQFTSALIGLVKSGAVSQARLNEAVRRVLTLKFELWACSSIPTSIRAEAQAGVVARERS